MNYAEYREKQGTNNSHVAQKYAAGNNARGKKTWGATSHTEDLRNDTEFRENIDKLFSHKHTSYAGKKNVHICVTCLKPVGIITRRKQKDKFIVGKGYTGLLCAYHLRLEKELS